MREEVDHEFGVYWTPPIVVGVMIDAEVQNRLRTLLLSAEPKGPGRPATTSNLAEFIDKKKERECSWQQITDELNTLLPSEEFTKEQVRSIWRRYFGKKSKK